MDQLLKGGIRYFRDKPLTLLITGPPGTGKTTLALEMCYRLAQRSSAQGDTGIGARSSLFVSTDSESRQLIEHARSFGWPDVDRHLFNVDSIGLREDTRPPDSTSAVAILGSDRVKKWDTLLDLVEEATKELLEWITHLPPKLMNRLMGIFRIQEQAESLQDQLRSVSPHVVVFDGLNALTHVQQGDVFQTFLKGLRSVSQPPNLVVLILDTGDPAAHPSWEYVCDLVIRLDHAEEEGYYRRTLEIRKARYQEHVWGKHQVKIYPGSDFREDDDATKYRRAHPYRREGGLYIYPSIHYYLSAYKRITPRESPTRADTLPLPLNVLLRDGYPEERCSAFIGDRGTHKSHLAYLHLLHRILNRRERGLVVSLRDDEAVTRHTLAGILEDELHVPAGECDGKIRSLEQANRLEILYYVPGYITPEEFMHRMLMSVYRMKKAPHHERAPRLTVLFNSLDQLAARFPLCANERIFVPGVIEVLSGTGTTTIFVAVEEPGQPPEQYGLLSMADLIVRFDRRQFPERDYLGHLKVHLAEATAHDTIAGERLEEAVADLERSGTADRAFRDVVVLQVERFSGGQSAGAQGMLEYVDTTDFSGCIYSVPGLHLAPLNRRYLYGTKV
ncbi:MAG: hypothetical protein LC808_00155 [Actinobacteria bacterium]|nr:hypothetical protein [Actinomycetota bacterium]